jgi:hypothetical protein
VKSENAECNKISNTRCSTNVHHGIQFLIRMQILSFVSCPYHHLLRWGGIVQRPPRSQTVPDQSIPCVYTIAIIPANPDLENDKLLVRALRHLAFSPHSHLPYRCRLSSDTRGHDENICRRKGIPHILRLDPTSYVLR